ncbi:autotransporter outer membrane beta-barrel domain-containing protein [Mucilaginibacter glaciei]|uniref:Peptidase S74 domain-containing protein n=1 Tax=Mucilaginibacter glaciei TaxID=2772109 RepID=A0A926S3E2_9SPHI|nr:hypothetical protein [Mucilaginibacter glaciei]MBD1394842.1 hypothetical protein [Mucilaginibacter glaciei]
MKKLLFTAGLFLLIPSLLMAQFSNAGGSTTTLDQVGIGTTSPINKLHVYSTSFYDGISVDGTNNPALLLRNAGTIVGQFPGLVSTAGIYFGGSAVNDIVFRSSSGKMLFGFNGSYPTMAIANGKVGIGNLNSPDFINPVYPLNVNTGVGSGFGYLAAMFSSNSAEFGIGINNYGQDGRNWRFLAAASGSSVGAGNFGIADATAGFTRMVINPAGNIGIGTVSPADRLDIQGGNMSVYSGGGTNLKIGSNATGKTYMLINTTADANGAGSIQSVGNSNNSYGSLLLDPNGGNVGVGISAPISKLHVTGNGNSLDDYNPLSGQSLTVQANTGGRSLNVGAQLEFAIPANTDGTNFYGQGRIMTVAGNTVNNDATGKMILGTKRYFDKSGAGSQWFYGNDLTIDGSGKIGIGVLSPTALMHVRQNNSADGFYAMQRWDGTNSAYNLLLSQTISSGATSWNLSPTNNGQISSGLTFKNGSVGVGDTDPTGTLSVANTLNMITKNAINPVLTMTGQTKSYLHAAMASQNGYVRSAYSSNIHWVDADNLWHIEGGQYSDFSMMDHENSGDIAFYNRITTGNSYNITHADLQPFRRLTIKNNGNVGIGTPNTDAKLTVNGNIHTTEVRVDLNVPAPDYVFEEKYKLNTLKDVEAFISKMHHLPEVPSAKEMSQNGINLGEMNTLLLKKIEELTLYLIEKDKQLDAEAALNKKQQKDIDLLKAKLGISL